MEDRALLDPETIPLPEDIPIPDGIPLPDDILIPEDIPLPPDEDYPVRPGKRQASDDDYNGTANDSDPGRQHSILNNHKKAKRDETIDRQHHRSRRRNKTQTQELSLPDDISKEQEMMAKIMGFSNFDTTKGKMVPGNQAVGTVHVVKKRRYRQYMNRKGGFNRPLDKVP